MDEKAREFRELLRELLTWQGPGGEKAAEARRELERLTERVIQAVGRDSVADLPPAGTNERRDRLLEVLEAAGEAWGYW